ncbi:MAG: prepilin-type N-terminal cleavage/methylation domain-containing protein [Magnetococcales bacterium]|nr:prepilin-type N-terminal cleavage/methylation domain-containing protein [Magnetococcales bacterium]
MKNDSQALTLHRAGGFTMIELIMVIVILGILAAVAIPKFTNLSSNARTAAVAGIAGGLSSANSTNVAVCSASSTNANCVTTTGGCTSTVAGNLLQGGLPTGYTVSGSTSATGGATPTTVQCTLTDSTSGATATFNITGAP